MAQRPGLTLALAKARAVETDVHAVAIIAAIIREVSGGVNKHEAVIEAREYLKMAREAP